MSSQTIASDAAVVVLGSLFGYQINYRPIDQLVIQLPACRSRRLGNRYLLQSIDVPFNVHAWLHTLAGSFSYRSFSYHKVQSGAMHCSALTSLISVIQSR